MSENNERSALESTVDPQPEQQQPGTTPPKENAVRKQLLAAIDPAEDAADITGYLLVLQRGNGFQFSFPRNSMPLNNLAVLKQIASVRVDEEFRRVFFPSTPQQATGAPRMAVPAKPGSQLPPFTRGVAAATVVASQKKRGKPSKKKRR